MSVDAVSEPMRRPRRPAKRRHVWRWIVLGLVILLAAVALWIVVRGLIARDQLTSAVPLVEQLKTKIVEGDTDGLQSITDQLETRAATAAQLTSDPIWRAVEVVPFLGPNLTAFREAAHAIDTLTAGALPPLVSLAGDLDFAKFVPQDGVIDTAPILALQPALAEAGAAVAAAAQEVNGIDTSGTIAQIGEAVDQLVGVVSDANALIGGANGLVQVLPAMLGADEPRTTLLLVQNNAELRATGGIPGAVIELHTDGGRIEFGRQSSGGEIGEFDAPVVPVTDVEEQLYSEKIATFMQNVTVTPDFARSGEIAAAMWEERFGREVDAVVSVDPVVLSFILAATGPIELAEGTVLSAENAVDLLLNEVYFRYEDPAEQDLFFAVAAQAVFNAIMHFDGDPQQFVTAIGRGVGEHRIYVWSAHSEEQAVIAADGSPLAGLLPRSDAMASGFGLYLLDTTMSKVDWYVTPSVSVSGVACPMWGDHPYYELHLTLSSSMPPGGEGVPDYVTGPTVGDDRGTALTSVQLMMPSGFKIFQTLRDGVNSAVQIVDGGDEYARYSLQIELPPGGTTEVTFRIWGEVGAPAKVRFVHTPTAGEFPTSVGESLACPKQDEVPTEGEPGIIALGPAGVAARFGV